MAELLAVHGPTPRPELVVDDRAGGGLVEVDSLGRLLGLVSLFLPLLRRCLRSGRLEGHQVGKGGVLLRLGLLGDLLPQGPFLRNAPGVLFGGFTDQSRSLRLFLRLLGGPEQAVTFSPQPCQLFQDGS